MPISWCLKRQHGFNLHRRVRILNELTLILAIITRYKMLSDEININFNEV